MLSQVVIIGSITKAPQRVDANTILFQVVSRTGHHVPRPILFHVSANGELAQEFFDLRRGNEVLIEASFKTTPHGNPPLHHYPDGKPYVQFDVIAEVITKIKIPT